MKRRSIFWQMVPIYLVPVVLSLFLLAIMISGTFRRFFMDRNRETLEMRSRLFSVVIEELLLENRVDEIQKRSLELGKSLSTRFTVILPSGVVVGDSESEPASMENHASRPEIRTAMLGQTGSAVRFSYTLDQSMMYVAVPLEKEGRVVAVVRSSRSISSLNEILARVNRRIAVTGLLLTAAVAGLILFLTRRFQRPIEELHKASVRLGSGDFDYRVHIQSPYEFAYLANTMNELAQMLQDRLKTITKQKSELESILFSMQEGILVLDSAERIINMNRAAVDLFGLSVDPVKHTVQETVRNIELLDFIRAGLRENRPASKEITLHLESERIIEVHRTPLLEDSKQTGLLLVFSDVTRSKRLENLRRDFVANVSHELKTPITAIKGSVETLMDGAGNDPEHSAKFLAILQKHTDRLNTIIEDLLSLSRIESHEDMPIVLESEDIRPVLQEAVNLCVNKAGKKDLSLILEAGSPLPCRHNAPLLEEAVVNLIDNAIQYSNSGQTIRVTGTKDKDSVLIHVEDQGIGIPEDHLPRIFERFYRVDKARSRRQGGTGLGLSIVKHIVLAHQGSVDVESQTGKGSRFTIRIPLSAD